MKKQKKNIKNIKNTYQTKENKNINIKEKKYAPINTMMLLTYYLANV